MPMEHYRPNGDLSQGYFCENCGQPCGMYGHLNMKDNQFNCDQNVDIVRQLHKANPPRDTKPHFTKLAVIRE